MKTSTSTILLLLLLPLIALSTSVVWAQESVGPRWDRLPYSLSTDAGSDLSQFSVIPSQSQVAQVVLVRLQFGMPLSEYVELHNGGLSFTFPDGFDLTTATVQEISDDVEEFGYFITKSTVSGQTITANLKGTTALGGMVTPPVDTVAVTVILADVVNPTLAGEYQLAAVALDADGGLVAGPSLSQSFEITPGPASNLAVLPQEDLELLAGDVVGFQATVTDVYENPITDAEPAWSLTAESDDIGVFEGSSFRATNPGVGQVLATVGDLSALSGQITVISGGLARVELELATQQIIGRTLLVEPQVVLRDQFDNLLTDYDLAANPLTLQTSQGTLTPSVISDPALFSSGVVSLQEAGVIYTGLGGEVEITAATGGVASKPGIVSFNGYEILAIEAPGGGPLNSVTAEAVGSAQVIVQHNGSLNATLLPTLTLSFAMSGGSTSATVPLLSGGEIDTVQVTIPAHIGDVSNDTLKLELRARFGIQGTNYTATTISSQAVAVRTAGELTLVPGSLHPLTIYPGRSYQFGFEADYSNLPGTPDSARVTMLALESGSGPIVATIFDGWAQPSSVTADRIEHTDLVGGVYSTTPAGTYDVQISYELATDGTIVEAEDLIIGSITVVEQLDMEYVAGSLRPSMVAAGVGAAFAFEVRLNNEYDLTPSPVNSEFELRRGDFKVTANLLFPGDQITAGQVTIQTGQVVIPDELIGMELEPQVQLAFELEEADALLTFSSGFDGETVQVEQLPVARIESVQPVTTNGTFVNTGQSFHVACRVSNESSSPLGPLELTMVSDGNSRFEPVRTIELIEPGETAEVLFDVIASEVDALSEVFRVDITTTGISVLPPIDNVALITIQQPAALTIDHELLGVEDSLVEFSGDFSLTIQMANTGQAAVSAATYELSTGGVDFGFGSSALGTIRPGETAVISFQAPAFDTATTLTFRISELPIELNTERTVSIDGEPFEVRIRVISAEGDLFVDPYLTGPNVVLPGRVEELFSVDIANRGVSTFARIELQAFTMRLFTADRQPLEVAEVLSPSNSGFYLEDDLVTDLRVESNRMHFDFHSLSLDAGEELTLTFRSFVREEAEGSFLLVGDVNEVAAEFVEGPNAGLSPDVVTSEDQLFLLEQIFVIKGSSLDESFVVEANPVDPASAPARFTYELDESGTIEFRVFTLTGEEVYSKDYPEGTAGTETGEHELFWDGRNNDGYMVLNGVYVATITNTRTGEQARIKIAIVK